MNDTISVDEVMAKIGYNPSPDNEVDLRRYIAEADSARRCSRKVTTRSSAPTLHGWMLPKKQIGSCRLSRSIRRLRGQRLRPKRRSIPAREHRRPDQTRGASCCASRSSMQLTDAAGDEIKHEADKTADEGP